MEVINTRAIDTKDEKEIELFEKSFFQAFVGLVENQLIKKIWNWDFEQKRLRTKIPYADLEIYSWRHEDGSIKSAIAANLNNEVTQFSQFGFSFPVDDNRPYCEIVVFYTDNIKKDNGIYLNSNFLKSHCVPYIHSFGYKSLYSTCAERPLLTYLRWGWKVLDEVTVDGEKRFFIHFDIEENLMK